MKDGRRLIEAVRRACIDAAVDGYEQASIAGLCHEGAFEAALSAIRRADLDALAGHAAHGDPGPTGLPEPAGQASRGASQPGRPSTRGRSRIGA